MLDQISHYIKRINFHRVNVKIICEKLINNEWYLSDENFTEDEKRLTLKILETAQTLANT